MPGIGKEKQLSDVELVDICNGGSAHEAARAFTALYQRHKDFVTRVSLRLCGDHDLALDALQDTFAYLLKQFPPGGQGLTLSAKLTTYLYPIAKNTTISLLRKRQHSAGRQRVDPDTLAAPEGPGIVDLSGLLGDLSSDRREVVLLRFVDDMSLSDIATALDIPLGTVKSRLHLAIKELRKSPKTKQFFDR